jgi:histidinol dehydrogenase
VRTRRFEWGGAAASAAAIRAWVAESAEPVDVLPIQREVIELGDEAVLALTARHDAPENPPDSLRVDPALAAAALTALDPALREALDVAAANVRTVAEASFLKVRR